MSVNLEIIDNLAPAAFSINLDGVASNLSSLDELKQWNGIYSDMELGILFNLSITNEDKLKIEELLLIVKYNF